MVQSCLIIGCKPRYNKSDGISFFSFPSNKIESEKWRDSILNNQKGVITKNSKICQFHFNESDIKRHGVRTVLKKGAKPTIFHNQRNSTEVNEFMDVEYLELGESLALNPVSLHTVETVPVSLESVESVPPSLYSVEPVPRSLYSAEPVPSALSKPNDSTFISDTTPTKTAVSNNSVEIDTIRRGTKRRLCYPGDVQEVEDLTPRSCKKFIRSLQKTAKKPRVKIKNLHRKRRRAVRRIVSLQCLVRKLKRKNLISENALESLKLQDDSLMQKIKVGKINNQFPADVRSFALTLNFYSPRAYRYVRKTFANKLPTPRTIRKWYESVDAEPGITEEALKALAIRVDESKKKGVYLRFCLSMDEMSIREQIEYSKSRKKFYGYVDVGPVSITKGLL
ncbi:DNA transposase THAP9 [Pseudolycoriella hygida]|uniref:DNA transposase THAP9 n=1 Tax=Pseudolycoriella hygida TaxID=35572 RepID=A0A9Q0ND86_9DIPT|nr:DNA transposase THAP9 [Pseudolycoriella hygida]